MIVFAKISASKVRKAFISIILIGIVIGLILWPLIAVKNSEFKGTDNQAEEVIMEINEDYKPWFESIYKPSSSEIENIFFAIQAAIGIGIIGVGLSYLKRSKKKEDKKII